MLQTDILQLPRPLVNQLLHQAQTAVAFTQGFILGQPGNRLRCLPLELDADLESTLSDLGKRGVEPFAFYRSSSTPAQTPTAQDLHWLAGTTAFYLGIFLETKGVLQLRGWRIEGTRVVKLDVTIQEV